MKKKLISTNTKRNVAKVRRRLESEMLTVKLFGEPDRHLSAGEALLLGGQFLATRQEQLALQIAQQLNGNFGDIIDVQLLKMRALLSLESLVEAKHVLDLMLDSAPSNIGVLAVAVQFNIVVGDVDRAFKYIALSERKKPNHIENLLQMAECYRLTGDTVRAQKVLRKCLTLIDGRRKKGDEALKLYRGVVFRLAELMELTPEQINDLESMLALAVEPPDVLAAAAFALARQASRQERVKEESALLSQANHWQAISLGCLENNAEFQAVRAKHLQMHAEVFASANPAWLHNFSSNSTVAPIFILGMPRSGTTLIEQMLGAHSAIGQTGESKALPEGVVRAYARHQAGYSLLDYPQRFDEMPSATLTSMAEYYEEHQKLLTNKKMYLDKELSSFKFVGLAAHLFPKANFIHMNRAPMDIFLSCYKGSIPGISATCNLEHLAIYYIYMKKLIGHWKKIFPDRLHVLDYADLVDDPEANIRSVVKFLGIDFQAQMLEFHKRKNVVRTLSVDQVRKGIYKTSVKKWLPYADMLEPARKILEQHGISEEGVLWLD